MTANSPWFHVPGADADVMIEASRLMKRGLALLEGQPTRDVVDQAIACFDGARALRSRLPLGDNPVFRYDLAACWLNRGEALARSEAADDLHAAVAAYEEGIALLRGLPLAEDQRFSRRLAIAHQNRGLALTSLGTASYDSAVAAFLDAIEVLDDPPSHGIADRSYLLASVIVNLAKARMSQPTPLRCTLAQQDALRAIDLVRPLERNDVDAARVGLTARHVYCQVIAVRGLPDPQTMKVADDTIHEATDLAEEGLELVGRWERAGNGRFRRIAADLLHFGARVYSLYQPQFLNEFVREQADPANSSAAYVDSAEIQAVVNEIADRVMPPPATLS